VVGLRYLADLSEADTAKQLGISVGSVKQHGRRALQAMRERLDIETLFERKE
jgi:DNA-directed RNA polymerase specialized sigma24 family protein